MSSRSHRSVFHDGIQRAFALDNRQNAFYSHFVQPTEKTSVSKLKIEGLGTFSMPLSYLDAGSIIAECRKAPYGKGTETLIDESVRRTWQIDADRVSVPDPAWPQVFESIMGRVCDDLTVPGGRRAADAHLYKLLVYEEGSMFKPHKDSEKAPGMFGTLVISLPSSHGGGDVEVTLGDITHTLGTDDQYSTCMAWYSDVVHEVKPVTWGYRVVLVYNLTFTGMAIPSAVVDSDNTTKHVKNVLSNWRAKGYPKALVYALEHQYTDASMRADALKGNDSSLVHSIMAVQEELGLKLFLASMEKREYGTSDELAWLELPGEPEIQKRDPEESDQGYDWDGKHWSLDFIEDSKLDLTEVRDIAGKHVLKNVPVDPRSQLVQGELYADRMPDREKVEPTGNQGAEATHWYRNTVILIVLRENWLDIVLSSKPRRTYSPGSLFDELRRLLAGELAKFRADNGDTSRQNCKKICEFAIYKHLCEDNESFRAVFECCVAIGEHKLAAYTIPAATIDSSEDLLAVLKSCVTINRNDCLRYANVKMPPLDTDSFPTIFETCLSMGRWDLAAKAVKRFRTSPPKSEADVVKTMVPLLEEASSYYGMEEILMSLVALSDNWEDIAIRDNFINEMSERMELHGDEDLFQFRKWRSQFMTA